MFGSLILIVSIALRLMKITSSSQPQWGVMTNTVTFT